MLHTLSPREHQAVALVARGYANKVIAGELGVTVSTVSVYLLKAGRKLGVRGRVALIHAFHCALDGEPALPPALSTSERAVAALMLRGASNAEIAEARAKSARTVANQVASIFRKLGVRSRGELAARFAPRAVI
jgi:DNA-binding NarL/FixJ family response regulator